jgi:DNA-binding MarR family transcriptional regulator
VKKTEEIPQPAFITSERILGRIGFLLNKGAQKVREVYEETLKPFGLTGRHAGVLFIVQEKGSITQQEIGKCAHIDRTTMVDVVDDLEKLGLVERKANPTDRRSHSIFLTRKCRESLPSIEKLCSKAENDFLECLTEKEHKELVRILRKLVLSHYMPKVKP